MLFIYNQLIIRFIDVIQTIYKGFNTEMAFWVNKVPENIKQQFNRGGLYELSEPIIISILVFVYIGTIDKIDAMTTIAGRVFRFAKKRSTVFLSSLISSGITNAITSNQYATSFVVGDAFVKKYDMLKIPRKVLSRSLENYGTMIEKPCPVDNNIGIYCGNTWNSVCRLLALATFIANKYCYGTPSCNRRNWLFL